MKRASVTLAIACLLIMIFTLSVTANAVGEASTVSAIREKIDRAILDELSKANIPNAAIAIIRGDEIEYVFYPKDGDESPDEMHTLFQIGSVSKAYTGLGILLLEDKGLLSLDDPVSKYLPWFTVSYEGKSVPPEEFTIANALYQTSGFTNSNAKYPSASNGMSIEESVRQCSGIDLTFYPSQQYAYANTNFRILGLIIETISGQSYDAFMTQNILLPLGLDSTYTSPQNAQNTGKVVEGKRLSFLQTWTYDVPVVEGNVPAGYIYSNIQDMSRWLQIHMGAIEVPEQLQRIIEKSHQPNPGSVVDNQTHYAAGWFIHDETGEIYHSGGTPNYSANVAIRPQSRVAVCVLTNMNASSNTNNIAANILNILEGKSVKAYQADVWVVFDLVFSVVTILCVFATAVLIFITVRLKRQNRNGQRENSKPKRKSALYFIAPSVTTVLVILFAIILPITFNDSWMGLLVWAPPSLFAGMVSLLVLSACAFNLAYSTSNSKRL